MNDEGHTGQADIPALVPPAVASAVLLSAADLAWNFRRVAGSDTFGVGDIGLAVVHSLVIAVAWALSGVLVIALIRRLGTEAGEPRPSSANCVAGADLALLVVVPIAYVAHRAAFASLGWTIWVADVALLLGWLTGTRVVARMRPWSEHARPYRGLGCTLLAFGIAVGITVALRVHVKLGMEGAIRASTLRFVVILVMLTAALASTLEFLTRKRVRRVGGRRRLVHAAGAIALFGVHQTFFVGQYDAVHALLLGTCWVQLTAAVVGWSPALLGPRRPWQAPVAAVAGAVILVWSAMTLDSRQPAGALILGWSNTNAVLVRLARTATDWDGDGASSLWGGTDAAAFDGRIHPLAREIPGNGVDENGIGGDLSLDAFGQFVDGLFEIPETGTAAPCAGLNVVWINLCSVRADHLGAYGYTRRPATPRMDRFAEEAVVFERACSAAPWTSLSILNNLRSRSWGTYADGLEALSYGNAYLESIVRAQFTPDEDTLFHAFGAAGYRCEIVSGDRTAVRKAFRREIPVEEEMDAILRGLAGQPFFLWVQLSSTHRPYVDHEEVESFGDGLLDQYDTQLRFVDLRVGAVLDAVDAAGVRDRTIVIVLGEHGEALNERGVVNHGLGVYETELHVPLMIRVPGTPAHRVPGLVSSLDLTPTLVEMAGLDWSTPCEGRSLRAPLGGRPTDPDRRVFAQNLHAHLTVVLRPDTIERDPFRHQVVIRKGRLKLIYDRLLGGHELYDLDADPAETHNLSFERLDLIGSLEDELARWIDVHDARDELREYLDEARQRAR